jgi:hypothetical protein
MPELSKNTQVPQCDKTAVISRFFLAQTKKKYDLQRPFSELQKLCNTKSTIDYS